MNDNHLMGNQFIECNIMKFSQCHVLIIHLNILFMTFIQITYMQHLMVPPIRFFKQTCTFCARYHIDEDEVGNVWWI